jgi:hypothetical protein
MSKLIYELAARTKREREVARTIRVPLTLDKELRSLLDAIRAQRKKEGKDEHLSLNTLVIQLIRRGMQEHQ